jgi:signal transduction histidine kinase/ActR/RegA family two-component response regulator
MHDIGMRKQTENIMQARLRLLEFANSHSLDEFLTATLDEIESLTESSIGFYHFLEEDQATLSLQNWSTNTLNTMCKADGKGSHYDVSQAGVWADCVRERCPVIHNDYYSLEYRRGIPEGHAPVTREAIVPVFRGDQIKAIIGVGNKSTDYGEFDILAVSQLGDLSWDIVERKLAEEALMETNRELEKHRKHLETLVQERTRELSEARDAAESSNRAKSIFLANMSHELRTPLNAILGFTQLMNNDTSVPDHAKQNLAIINRSGEHLLSMINDVLDLSKIEAGKVELKEEPFDLTQTVEDIGEMIRARAREKHLEVIIDIDPNVEQYIKADLGKLRQILINLLGNSVKFTNDGGIALRVRTLRSPENKAFVTLDIEIEDTGPGIPKDKLKTIFIPFIQVGSVKSSLKGTGLGLTISQSYAKMMGGKVSVKSTEGNGSTFKLQVNAEVVSKEMVNNTEINESVVIGIEDGEPDYRILIVEDNDDNAILLSTLLTQAGLNTRIAKDGKEGTEVAEAWRPHFIWMDMKMPVMTGYEATRFIRSQTWGKEIVIAAFTASAFSDQENDIFDAGCNCLVRKPFRSQEIFKTMSKYLGVRFKYSKTQDHESTDIGNSNKTEIPTASELELLPKKLVENILEAASELDKNGILAIARQFTQTQPNLAAYLKEQASSYNFEAIETLFSSIKKKKAS